MKRLSKYLFLFVLGFAFILVGCGSNLKMPSKDAIVYGNGGNVVQKGEYLYFANAFTSYSTLSDSAVKNGDKEFGIYRTKLTSENNVEIAFDENGFAKDVEAVSSKLAGFESLGMYIVGEHLFFASPNMHKTASNQNRYDFISFFSIKLDGSGLKELYTTFSNESSLPSSISQVKWKIYNVGQSNYLLTIENDKIVRHTISGNSLKDKTVLAEDVKDALLPETIVKTFDEQIHFIADFSKEQSEEFGYSGTILKSVNMVSKETKTLNEVNGETIALVAHQASKVFYTIKSADSVKEGLYVLGQTSSSLKIANTTSRTNFFYMGEDKPLVFTSNSKVFIQNLTRDNLPDVANFDFEELIDSNVTVLFVSGDYVYYTNGSGLMRISYKNKESQTIISEQFEANSIDFDGKYVYAYKNLNEAESTTKYLHRVKVSTVETSEIAKFEVIGYVLENDKEAIIEAQKDQDED